MENYAGAEVGTMFELSVFKIRTPPHRVAFFFFKRFRLGDVA
jgi:hypothetical protein